MIRIWQQTQWGIDALAMTERPAPEPGPHEVVVRMQAAALNSRDLRVVLGKMVTASGPGSARLPLVPLSDGAGVVVRAGHAVTRVKAGDRVCPMFFQTWLDGRFHDSCRDRSLGATVPGVLQEEMLLHEDGVARFPDHLSFAEAACLPCAALTAWHALVARGGLRAGQSVLVQGTGGVSLFALQFARMLGATVIVLSGSDAKLDRARALGADHTINYRTTPAWSRPVLDLTGGAGVDHVVEVGGRETLAASIEAAACGAGIHIIGLLSGVARQISPLDILLKNLAVNGISVGSRTHFEAMCEAIAAHRMVPVIDRVFPFAGVPDALRFLAQGSYFGKNCIDLTA